MSARKSTATGFRKESPLDPTRAEGEVSVVHRDLRLAGGLELRLRKLRSGDRDSLKAFYSRCSSQALRFRFMSSMSVPPDSLVDYMADADGFLHMALIVTHWEGADEKIVAEGRYVVINDRPDTADIAFLVVDDLQRRGIATRLMGELAEIARRNGLRYFSADVLGDNWAMLSLIRKTAHPVSANVSQGVTHFTIALAGEHWLPEAA